MPRYWQYQIKAEPVLDAIAPPAFDPANGFPYQQTVDPFPQWTPRYTWVYRSNVSPVRRPTVAEWYRQASEPIRAKPVPPSGAVLDPLPIPDAEVYDPAVLDWNGPRPDVLRGPRYTWVYGAQGTVKLRPLVTEWWRQTPEPVRRKRRAADFQSFAFWPEPIPTPDDPALLGWSPNYPDPVRRAIVRQQAWAVLNPFPIPDEFDPALLAWSPDWPDPVRVQMLRQQAWNVLDPLPVEEEIGAGRHRYPGRRKKRVYELPNGMRIRATPEEAEAWLRRSDVADSPQPFEEPSVAPPSALADWEKPAEVITLPTSRIGRPLADLAKREAEILAEAVERQRLRDEDEVLALLLLMS
jgi:hypothetical protein